MNFSEFEFVLLGADIEIKPFRSIDKDLNDFLLSDSKNYLEELVAVTYLLEDPSHDKTVAYFSLLNDSLTADPDDHSEWNRLNRAIHNSKRRKQYPAVKIGRLAVSEEYMGKGIGSSIMRYIKLMLTHGNRTGCRFLTVDAYTNAVGFYESTGFRFITKKDEGEDTRLMYYDLKRFLNEEK